MEKYVLLISSSFSNLYIKFWNLFHLLYKLQELTHKLTDNVNRFKIETALKIKWLTAKQSCT